MAADKKLAPIIVKKKKAGHGGAHGGAWKVAYADFVTAMMAFFMVMWLLGSDEEVKAAVSSYFNNPTSALRPDLTSKEALPLGDKTGAGDSVLKGAGGETPEDMASRPQRPLMEGNTEADEQADSIQNLASNGDKLVVEVMKFSVAERDLFLAGSSDKWQGSAPAILAKVGKLMKQNRGKLTIRGQFGSPNHGSYEFQVSRTVAVARYLVDKKFAEDDRVVTSMRKWSEDRGDHDRTPANATEPRIEFSFQP